MENDDYSSNSEEKMLETEFIDYSKFLKPRPNATIHVGKEFQATLPKINENKNKRELKEFEEFKKQSIIKKRRRLRLSNSNSTFKDKIFVEDELENNRNKKLKLTNSP